METLKLVLTVVQVLLAIVLIITVLLQQGKSAGLSGSIAGGAETFFGKNKARTMDALLSKITGISAALFLILSLVLSLVLR